MLAAGLSAHSDNPNALVNPEARAQIDAAELAELRGALEGSLRTIFWASAGVVVISIAVAVTLPAGRVGAGQVHGEAGERMVIAEMTNIDPAHEPEA